MCLLCISISFRFFFFQAEDGIRAGHVTGVQTCALPISAAVEESYRWSTDRGLAIVKTSIVSIEYDKRTRELLADVQKADALSGNRSRSEEHTSELQSRGHLVCRLLLEKKKSEVVVLSL